MHGGNGGRRVRRSNAGNAAESFSFQLSSPILLGLSPHRWRIWVFHFNPIRRQARPIRRAKPFAYNTLASKSASLAKYDLPVILVNLIEDNARMRTLEQLGEQRLAVLDWFAAQILAVKLKQVERAKDALASAP